MTSQLTDTNYEMIQFIWSFSHFSNLAKILRKMNFLNLILGPFRKWNFVLFSIFLLFW